MDEHHGCYDRPIGGSYVAQDGWDVTIEGGKVTKTPIYKLIPFVFTTHCVYSRDHTKDPKCDGCNKRAVVN